MHFESLFCYSGWPHSISPASLEDDSIKATLVFQNSAVVATVSTIKHILALGCGGGGSGTSFLAVCQALPDVGVNCLGIICYLENPILTLFREKHEVRSQVSFGLPVELLMMKR